ncbi:MAG: hypothetical protein COX89_01395 [Candidatus Nealsonbacteria bacterium CG_4_10_14_0_2_um_filter_37_10]|uniref:Uncharacterized protein n=3 Tax=Candidatus Nealsoniibacteriota TaxID=1817911 RepID=A0A2H0TJQ6_9BACT|nr:MAG: hypothetical protein COU43_00700 [Candidatus Nealsonbacteria bacterium CG10_big_fil_rev_8_21_14_0_10_37_25]PIZ89482.1 MAG: hypothetical protein COX89_01395 [Candidatus Nealsonbacteria bacterium CG_4_10_14_0_2_um_filter_37_10]PJA84539.1 MAG: hypothetical protein CO145_01075 [Candidatus Nealsonbacteria bacterium CG_4_9_14_3_um_filter_37_13]
MAITFIEKRRRLRYLFPVLAIVILITAIVLWQGFFVEEKPLLPPIEVPVKKIEINYEILKHPLLEKLQFFEDISPFEGEFGRENPFLPY